MSLSELLKTTGFTSALIVDDAFDQVPVATDLAMDDEAWTIFGHERNAPRNFLPRGSS
jgi:hypothetical protein